MCLVGGCAPSVASRGLSSRGFRGAEAHLQPVCPSSKPMRCGEPSPRSPRPARLQRAKLVFSYFPESLEVSRGFSVHRSLLSKENPLHGAKKVTFMATVSVDWVLSTAGHSKPDLCSRWAGANSRHLGARGKGRFSGLTQPCGIRTCFLIGSSGDIWAY